LTYDRRVAAAEALRRSPIADRIRSTRLVAVLRRIEPRAALLELVDGLAADGVRIFEVTFDGPTAADDLPAVRRALEARGCADAFVGAGTVRSIDDLERAVAVGAAFAVGPTLDTAVIERALAVGMPFVPGAFSPTEVERAWATGATFVKLFPASSLGPTYPRELRGPLPHIETIATGGIDASNARLFLDAGCVAVGVGGALTRATPAGRRALVAAVAGRP
jgi:2-dehydro-3-deoxyphosphogluconate aldolase/(4S)-4-hydroxy-2-oxoglutarate aldolase